MHNKQTASPTENGRKKPRKRIRLRIRKKSDEDIQNFSENRMYYEKLADKYESCDIDAHFGGQALYYYIIAME